MARQKPGTPYPLGATWDGRGVNFALFSEHATGVELCLFDDDDPARELRRVTLPEQTDGVWHGFFSDVQPGQRYGYRVHGPCGPRGGPPLQPEQGPARSLRQGDRPAPCRWADELFGYPIGAAEETSRGTSGTAPPFAPLAAVVDESRSPGATTARRARPWHETVIYEVHVKGLHASCTRTCPRSCAAPTPAWRREAVDRAPAWTSGVTAVELMPVHHHIDDRHLRRARAWPTTGATTRSRFFAPDLRYAASRRADGRCASSRRWCARCTPPASR